MSRIKPIADEDISIQKSCKLAELAFVTNEIANRADDMKKAGASEKEYMTFIENQPETEYFANMVADVPDGDTEIVVGMAAYVYELFYRNPNMGTKESTDEINKYVTLIRATVETVNEMCGEFGSVKITMDDGKRLRTYVTANNPTIAFTFIRSLLAVADIYTIRCDKLSEYMRATQSEVDKLDI